MKPTKILIFRVLVSALLFCIAVSVCVVAIFSHVTGFDNYSTVSLLFVTIFGAFFMAIVCLLDVAKCAKDFFLLTDNMDVLIKYHDSELSKLEYIDGKSDWIDLRCAEDIEIRANDTALVNLGISVKLPKGYEMIIAPRSSTFRNYGLLQTNSIGVIDESYSSDKDVLKWPCLATRDTKIKKNDRICQFRIIKHQPALHFVEKNTLGDNVRGGFGSTGTN